MTMESGYVERSFAMIEVIEKQTAPPARVLCVDDEPAIRDVLALHFRRHGFEVETAENGLAAWQLLSADLSRFEVVVTDNQMPDLTGIELVEKLRRAGFAGGIVFFSSTISQQNTERLAALRVELVEKGRPIRELTAALRNAAGRKQ